MRIEDIPPLALTPQMEKTMDKGLTLPAALEEQIGNNNRIPEFIEHRQPFVGESKLRQSLTKRPATALKDLRVRIEQYARLEDDQIPTEVASAEQTTRGNKIRADQGEPRGVAVNEVDKSKSHVAVVTVFKEPIYHIMEKIKRESFFTWPPKMLGDLARRNQKLRWTYHQDKGHMTQNCRALKQHLEDLVAVGHLQEYIDPDKVVTEQENPPPEPNAEHLPRLVINVIHGTTGHERE
ncbi:uncharacterized protein LOC114296277 [Camellia sinensis]|uniref:uncharacterized protein LOC114296277 n=1 Tax=Camellia sinensis TaxID=4442 RepID=UPI001035C662|nr:uncharacterized protein LOC114296277 [Camellia sinensis]